MSDDLTTGGRVLPITRWGTPVMHTATRPVTEFDDALRTLVRNMFATMDAAQGVGLAATQVGIDLAVFVFECPDDDDVVHSGVICNPQVTVPAAFCSCMTTVPAAAVLIEFVIEAVNAARLDVIDKARTATPTRPVRIAASDNRRRAANEEEGTGTDTGGLLATRT